MAKDSRRPCACACRLGELEEGERYEMVVTNDQGLWRCRMGDVLRCVGHWGSAPKVRGGRRPMLCALR